MTLKIKIRIIETAAKPKKKIKNKNKMIGTAAKPKKIKKIKTIGTADKPVGCSHKMFKIIQRKIKKIKKLQHHRLAKKNHPFHP